MKLSFQLSFPPSRPKHIKRRYSKTTMNFFYFTIDYFPIPSGHAGSELLISLQPASGVLYTRNSCCMSVWSPKPNFPRATLPRPKHAGSTCGQSHAYKFLHYVNGMLRASALNLSELRLSQCTLIFKAFRENLFKM